MHRGDTMIIDVADILKKKNAKKEMHLLYNENKFSVAGEDINFSKPVKLDLNLAMVGDILMLEGNLETELILSCSRCLEGFNYALNVPISEKFTYNPDNKDEEIFFIDSDTIDITEIIQNNIITSLPMKKLCKEDCKGLCQHCGTNRNFSSCNCEDDDIDPRLAKLKDLFSAE